MRLPVSFSTLQKCNLVVSIPSSRTVGTQLSRLSILNQSRNMASSSDINIENMNIKSASGVSLDEHQQTLVGSVLDVRILEPGSTRTNAHTSFSLAALP